MEDDLENRFFQKKRQELLDGNTKPFPTLIVEQERPDINDLIRRFCLFSPYMIPYKVLMNPDVDSEKLEVNPVKDYGELYILVNLNWKVINEIEWIPTPY